jgi:hypothetical protein
MDRITSYEFHCIFNRTSNTVDLKGKLSVDAIEEELAKAREACRNRYDKAESSRERRRLKSSVVQLGNLIEYGFARRAIYEGVRDPSGLIAMTLRYGKIEAKRRILAQRRAQIRSNSWRPMSGRYRR